MAITLMKQYDRSDAGHREFVCDYESDVADLPTDCAAGSTAFVIENGSARMLNSAGEWKVI